MSSPAPVHIGVLLLPGAQLLDISCVDLFGMLSPEYLSACPLPESIKSGAIPIHIAYISSLGSGSLASCTSSTNIRIDAGLDAPEVAPGKLDILLVPGPDPSAETEDHVKEFIKAHAETEGVTLMIVCTASVPAARAGVLKGKKATGPKELLGLLTKDFPDTEWLERRWAKDGQVWTSGIHSIPSPSDGALNS